MVYHGSGAGLASRSSVILRLLNEYVTDCLVLLRRVSRNLRAVSNKYQYIPARYPLTFFVIMTEDVEFMKTLLGNLIKKEPNLCYIDHRYQKSDLLNNGCARL